MKKKSSLTVLSPYIRQFLWPYKKDIFQALIFLMIAACAVLSIGFGLRYLVDEGFSGHNPHLLKVGFIFFLVTSAVLALAAYFRVSTTSWLAERVINDLRKTLFAHLLTLDQSYYDQARTGDLISRLNSDTTILLTMMTSSLATTVRSIIQLAGAGVMLVVTSPKLTGFVLLVIPFVLSPIGALGRRVRTLTKKVQEAQGLLEATATDYLQALQTLKMFVKEQTALTRFGHFLEAKMSHVKKRIHLRAFLVGVVIFLAFSSVSLVMWLGGREVLSGQLSPGDLSAFLFFSLVAAGSFNSLSDLLGEIQTAAGALERLVEIIETKPTLAEPKAPQPLEHPENLPLIFDHVSFAYPTQDKVLVLKEFYLSIKPGQTLAIVGPSGAGKTTLFHLLLRFYDPGSGKILLGETPLNNFSLVDRRSLFSVVSQEAVIFNSSLRENILFGAQENEEGQPCVSEETLNNVVEKAALTSFIQGLPEGLETIVGERGLRLSGGQKQRLAIARAFLRKTPFLLLDEATNALDAQSEFHIQTALTQLMKNRTTLVIAHRLSTVQNADQIIVLDQGRLVEMGTHPTLLKQKGLYYKFAQHQFFNGAGEEHLPPTEESDC